MLVKFTSPHDDREFFINSDLVVTVHHQLDVVTTGETWHDGTAKRIAFHKAGVSWISTGEAEVTGYEVFGSLGDVVARLNGVSNA